MPTFGVVFKRHGAGLTSFHAAQGLPKEEWKPLAHKTLEGAGVKLGKQAMITAAFAAAQGASAPLAACDPGNGEHAWLPLLCI